MRAKLATTALALALGAPGLALAQQTPPAAVPPAAGAPAPGMPDLSAAIAATGQRLQAAADRLRQAAAAGGDPAGLEPARQEARGVLAELRQSFGGMPDDVRALHEQQVTTAEQAVGGDDPVLAAAALDELRTGMGAPVPPTGAAALATPSTTAVVPPAAQVLVQAPAPEVNVEQPAPRVTVIQPPPQVIIEMPKPIVTFRQAQPAITVTPAAEPQVTVQQQGQANVEVRQAGDPAVAAQSSAPGQPLAEVQPGEPAPAAVAALPPAPSGLAPDSPFRGLRAEDLEGKAVEGVGGERIGEIDDIVVSRDGRLLAAVIGVGGFLGIGERSIAVPFDQLQMTDGDRLRTSMTRDAIAGMEAYDREAFQPLERGRALGDAARG